MICYVNPKELESKSALSAHMEDMRSVGRIAMVGIDAEAPKKFYAFSLPSDTGASEIGILSSHFGIKPKVILLEKGKRAIVGYDDRLTWIDSASASLILSMRLYSSFYEFLPLDRDDEIAVLHELGTLRADANGTVIWSVFTDVIEEFQVDKQDNLVLTVMDEPRKIIISLASGKVFFIKHN